MKPSIKEQANLGIAETLVKSQKFEQLADIYLPIMKGSNPKVRYHILTVLECRSRDHFVNISDSGIWNREDKGQGILAWN